MNVKDKMTVLGEKHRQREMVGWGQKNGPGLKWGVEHVIDGK